MPKETSKVRRVKPGESWICECGKEQVQTYYSQAHWDEVMLHTCSACGRVHRLSSGRLVLLPRAVREDP